jgi:hypothetical protein
MSELSSSVISTSWEKSPVAQHLGIEIDCAKESAILRVKTYEDDAPHAWRQCGPFSAESLWVASRVLAQAARLLSEEGGK